MLKWLAVIAAVLAMISAQRIDAQSPKTVDLVYQAPGKYQLHVRNAALLLGGPYSVIAHVSFVGTDQGVSYTIAESDTDDLTIDLPLPLDTMRGEGCYRVGFGVLAQNLKPPMDTSGSITTHACIDGLGVVTFPSYDDVQSPPPAPPANVRVSMSRGDWVISWDDRSADEVVFAPGIVLLDRPRSEHGAPLGSITFPEVQRNTTTVGPISFFETLTLPAGTCGYADVLVFAVGGDATALPGNTTVPFCFDGAHLSFPQTGSGPSAGNSDWIPVALLCAIAGSMLIVSALFLGRQR